MSFNLQSLERFADDKESTSDDPHSVKRRRQFNPQDEDQESDKQIIYKMRGDDFKNQEQEEEKEDIAQQV